MILNRVIAAMACTCALPFRQTPMYTTRGHLDYTHNAREEGQKAWKISISISTEDTTSPSKPSCINFLASIQSHLLLIYCSLNVVSMSPSPTSSPLCPSIIVRPGDPDIAARDDDYTQEAMLNHSSPGSTSRSRTYDPQWKFSTGNIMHVLNKRRPDAILSLIHI